MNTKYHPKTILFSSMGNRPDILSSWITNNNDINNEYYDYDIIIYTYTTQISDQMKQLLQHVLVHRESLHKSKFQNLALCYQEHPELFDPECYQNIIVLDDDINISRKNISQWIKIHQQYNLWISQPSFRSGPGLQISWEITKHKPNLLLHYSSFIEMTAPMFRMDILQQWITEFIPYQEKLSGWGTDLFYMLTLYPFHPQVYAVIDQILVQNPIRTNKTGKKGMKGLISKKKRKLQWEIVRHQQGWIHSTYPVLESGYVFLNGTKKFQSKTIELARLKTNQYSLYLSRQKKK